MSEINSQTPIPPKKTANKSLLTGCLVSVLVVTVIVISIAVWIASTPSKPAPKSITLNAQVSFDGSQFTIRNNDSFDWTDVDLYLNSSGFDLGYTFSASRLSANTSYTVGAMQFTKSDGTRFNPFTTKPLKLNISCKTTTGESGFFGCSW